MRSGESPGGAVHPPDVQCIEGDVVTHPIRAVPDVHGYRSGRRRDKSAPDTVLGNLGVQTHEEALPIVCAPYL